MDSSKKLTCIEFCAGYGGIHLGLRRALPNLCTIAFSEIEAFACANLVSKMESNCLEPAPIWTDLKTFPGETFRGKVDILTGGFPCQPFSCSGKRAADQDERHLWPYFVKQIESIQPTYCFFENVEGIISAKLSGDGWRDPAGTPVLLHVLRELERLGYRATWGIFSASEVGAPHQRKRVFILAHRSSEGPQGYRGNEHGERRERTREDIPTTQSSVPLWPSRPTEKQFNWEPPRVLGYSEKQCSNGDSYYSERSKRSGNPTPESRNSVDYVSWCDLGDTEPQMGRNTDGTPYWVDPPKLLETFGHRVDELRLLGNGVVPATVEKAWRVLYDRLIN